MPTSIPLVLLAAGMSTRYGRLKQLDPLGPDGEAIMDYNVFDAVQAGFDRVVYVVREEIRQEIRERVEEVVGDAVDVGFVDQTLEELPQGFRAPPERRKPWGTAQAVLCAGGDFDGPFGVCNADDLYGPDAFHRLHGHLAAGPPPTEAALVGYTLSDTLSGSGGVARGLCVLGRDGLLERVTEVKAIRQVDGWISGRETDGAPVELQGTEIVSMNLWGFTPPVLDLMERQFGRFLERWGADTTAEFYLSTALNGQVQIGATRVAVLHTEEQWFGVTHAGDREAARTAVRERVDAGRYPPSLREAFRGGT